MGNSTMNSEFPKSEQRAAVCYRQWRTKGEENNLSFLNRIIRSTRYEIKKAKNSKSE